MPTPVHPAGHAGNDYAEIFNEIMLGVAWKQHFQGTSLHGNKLLDVDKATTRQPIPMLHHDLANLGIAQQLEQFAPGVSLATGNLLYYLGDVIAATGCIV